uniref:Uncharacterized protein n=1 Tax=Lepeophtheirus salmonis TaxID=72036 RepID=A0A0K2TA60_LEPSM
MQDGSILLPGDEPSRYKKATCMSLTFQARKKAHATSHFQAPSSLCIESCSGFGKAILLRMD